MTGLRERNKSKRRAAILDATVSLLRTSDFGDITIESVAELAEVSPHTVYNLIGTRDELAFSLLARVVRRMTETAPESEPVAAEPDRALWQMTDHGVDALLAEPVAYRAIVRAVSAQSRWPGGHGQDSFSIYRRAVDALDDAGVLLPAIDPEVLARQALFGFSGAMLAWARGRPSEQFRDDAHLNLAVMLAATTTGDVRDRAQHTIDIMGGRQPNC